MKITRLEDITLYRMVTKTLPDGERVRDYEKQGDYKAMVQYLADEVSVAVYKADISKVHRICTIRHELEKLLIPKLKNSKDNISEYIIEYNKNKYSIINATPRYVDIRWR